MLIKKVKGTRDYFGDDANKLAFTFETLTKITQNYNFTRVISPVLESLELFSHLLGKDSEVVGNEVFSFDDRKKRKIALRPEGTAPVLRLLLESKQLSPTKKDKVYYFGSMFRYERPQQGRQREFYQFGVEVINDDGLMQMVELLQLGNEIVKVFQIKTQLSINWIGSLKDRAKFIQALKTYYKENLTKLSTQSQLRFKEGHYFRILDSKEDEDILVNEEAPNLLAFLPKEDQEKFNNLLALLKKLNIPFVVDFHLVRGLDYYENLVFEYKEIAGNNLGSKNTIIAGGSYNSLISKLDSKYNLPAIGFAIGIERLILASEFLKAQTELAKAIDFYFIILDNKYIPLALELAEKLRRNFKVEIDMSERKLKKLLAYASKNKVKKVVLFDKLIEKEKLLIKDLKTTKQQEIKITELLKAK